MLMVVAYKWAWWAAGGHGCQEKRLCYL